jgi:mycothiol synthase
VANDVGSWLELRRQAFADEQPVPGHWTEDDFAREFVRQPWWNPERLWLVEESARDGHGEIIGTVTVAVRDVSRGPRASIHWLAVLPSWRKRGIGRLLVATAELAAWHSGCRDVHLETHSGWRSAVALYRALGYKDVSEAVPSRSEGGPG